MTTLVASTRNYFAELWRAWNNFWFSPTDPATLALIRLLAGFKIQNSDRHLGWYPLFALSQAGLRRANTQKDLYQIARDPYPSVHGRAWPVHLPPTDLIRGHPEKHDLRLPDGSCWGGRPHGIGVPMFGRRRRKQEGRPPCSLNA